MELELDLDPSLSLSLNLSLDPLKLRGRRVPTPLAGGCPGHRFSAGCTRARCPAQPRQVTAGAPPHAGPRGGENPQWDR